MAIHFKTFLESFEHAVSTASSKGKSILSGNKETYSSNVSQSIRELKAESKNYSSAKKALKELDEVRGKFPGRKLEIVERAAGTATMVIDRVEELNISLTGYKKLLNEATENEAHVEKCAKDVKEDFNKVRALIKKGVIEKLEYEEGRGMFWTYPPMTYNHGKDVIFLGRPQCGVKPGGIGFTVSFPSYKSDQVGTIHCLNSITRQSMCLGGYEKILYTLAAKKRLSDMILVFRDWLGSYNPDSRYSNPLLTEMRIDKPNVQDDSYVKWLETREGKAYVNLLPK